jgi:hypothetical protein
MGVDADLLVHTIKNAGPLAAQLHATFQPIPQRHKKADTGRKEEGRDGRAFTVLGERKNTAKILNSEERLERLERLARLEEEKQQLAGEGAKKGAAISRVKGMLREARIIDNDALLSNKKPTKEVLRRFINTWPQVIEAWRVYTQKHGVGSGDTIAWKYMFDFVHGGHTHHETVKRGRALPLVFDDDKGEAATSVAMPPAVVEEASAAPTTGE